MCEDDKALSYVKGSLRNAANYSCSSSVCSAYKRLTQGAYFSRVSFHKCDKVSTTGTCRLARKKVMAQLLYGK